MKHNGCVQQLGCHLPETVLDKLNVNNTTHKIFTTVCDKLPDTTIINFVKSRNRLLSQDNAPVHWSLITQEHLTWTVSMCFHNLPSLPEAALAFYCSQKWKTFWQDMGSNQQKSWQTKFITLKESTGWGLQECVYQTVRLLANFAAKQNCF